MIRQIFSPGKVSSCCPFICWWKVNFGARFQGPRIALTSSNKQGLFEIQKKENWTTWGYFHLLAVVGEKTGAGVVISRCGQVGKGTQVIAFRVVPGTERDWWWFYDGSPLHLPMDATVTHTSNLDESSLEGDCTGFRSTILKGKLRHTYNYSS